MMLLRKLTGPTLPPLALFAGFLALAILFFACTNSDEPNGGSNNGSASGPSPSAENGDEVAQTPTPKTEEELEEIEREDPLDKKACTGKAKLKSRSGRASVELVATDFGFEPQCPVGAAAGDLVEFEVVNQGDTLHNFSAPARGIDFDIEAGTSQVVRIAMGDEKIEFFCKFHADQGMRGALFPGKTG